LNAQKPQGTVPTSHYDTVVVGAGPYGLSTAAHLLEQGLKVACFGKPIQFWSEQMPQGMCLRSYWWATNLSDPYGKYGIDKYFIGFTAVRSFGPFYRFVVGSEAAGRRVTSAIAQYVAQVN